MKNMFSNFLYTLFSLTFLMLLPTKATTFTKDIVNQTCKSCSETAPSPSAFSFDFCSASLGSVPVSHTTNLPGLGLIALELAAKNSTKTLSIITQMLQDGSESDSLQTCFELYTDVTVKLKECVVDYMDMEYDPVFIWVILIREAAEICEEGFGEEGSDSPLTFENYSLTQLCSIVICIMEEFYALPSSLANMLRLLNVHVSDHHHCYRSI